MKRLTIFLIFISSIGYSQLYKNENYTVIKKSSVGTGVQTYVLSSLSAYYDDETIVFKNDLGDSDFIITPSSGETIDGLDEVIVRCTNDFVKIIKDENVSNNWLVIGEKKNCFSIYLSGQFLLDPDEVNGWGVLGPYDNTNNQDLGNVDSNLNRNSGGFSFPFRVRIRNFMAWHKNNNADALAWGWILAKQIKTPSSNVFTTTYVLDEVADNGGVGPRDYSNNTNQMTSLFLKDLPESILEKDEVLILGVASPTAVATNRWVQIQSGYIEFEKL